MTVRPIKASYSIVAPLICRAECTGAAGRCSGDLRRPHEGLGGLHLQARGVRSLLLRLSVSPVGGWRPGDGSTEKRRPFHPSRQPCVCTSESAAPLSDPPSRALNAYDTAPPLGSPGLWRPPKSCTRTAKSALPLACVLSRHRSPAEDPGINKPRRGKRSTPRREVVKISSRFCP